MSSMNPPERASQRDSSEGASLALCANTGPEVTAAPRVATIMVAVFMGCRIVTDRLDVTLDGFPFQRARCRMRHALPCTPDARPARHAADDPAQHAVPRDGVPD